MAVEAKRGCGFRKVSGLYLVCKGLGMPCGRLPIPLTVCPTCSCVIKQSRGWTWIDIGPIADGTKCSGSPERCAACPLGKPRLLGRVGLIWIGEQFYPTPEDFTKEARELGVSRRISKIPRDFKLGETWVALAHPKAVEIECPDCDPDIVAIRLCSTCSGIGRVYAPGIFHMFKPEAIEKIVTQSQATKEEIARLEEQGIRPVVVPDNDLDHQGSAYDEVEAPLFESSGKRTK